MNEQLNAIASPLRWFPDIWHLLAAAVVLGLAFYVGRIAWDLLRLGPSEVEGREWRADIETVLPIIVWTADIGGEIEIVSRQAAEKTGFVVGSAAPPGQWIYEIHADDRSAFQSDWRAASASRADFMKFFRMLHVDGSYRWVLCQGRPVGSDEIPARWYGSIIDVEPERRITQELAEFAASLEDRIAKGIEELNVSNRRFSALFHDMNIAYSEQKIGRAKAMIDEIKAQGVTDFWRYAEEHPEFIDACLATITVSMVNDVLVRMMGYRDHEELLALPPTANAVDARSVMSLQLEAMFDERSHFTLFTVLTGKNDLRIPVAVGVNVTADWSSSMSTLVDISDQQRANEILLAEREKLAKANRAAAVSAASNSIASELSLPIAASAIAAREALTYLEANTSPLLALPSLERVLDNAEHMRETVQKTRDLVQRRRRPPKLIDINDVLKEAVTLLGEELKARNAAIGVHLSVLPSVVYAEYSEIQQVVVNLILNAADSMATTNRRGLVDVLVENSTDMVTIQVDDDGPDLPATEFGTLFDAFFNAKSGNLGMEMHICRSLVEALGGSLTASNKTGGGTRFVASFPAGQEQDATEIHQPLILGLRGA